MREAAASHMYMYVRACNARVSVQRALAYLLNVHSYRFEVVAARVFHAHRIAPHPREQRRNTTEGDSRQTKGRTQTGLEHVYGNFRYERVHVYDTPLTEARGGPGPRRRAILMRRNLPLPLKM